MSPLAHATADKNVCPTVPNTLAILVRSLDQLHAVLERRPGMIYCDFENVRRYRDAVAVARHAGIPIALATVRIVKPTEEGLLRQIADYGPDAILVRNLASLCYYRETSPDLPLIGDYSLNVANELSAAILVKAGLRRLTPSYDLNWRQFQAMLGRFPAGLLEVVVHQHMPMFHMEHCVFAHTLSDGHDHRDCGRPCERHKVDLRDRVGQAHPLVADVGCRNTLYNAAAQSAAQYLPRMKELGLRHFRIELLRETPRQAVELWEHYSRILAGDEQPPAAMRKLRVLNRLGVTAGTLDFE